MLCIHGIFLASEITRQMVCDLLKAICDLSLSLKRNNSICWNQHQGILEREKSQKYGEKKGIFSPDL
jgi:hypothetical protein